MLAMAGSYYRIAVGNSILIQTGNLVSPPGEVANYATAEPGNPTVVGDTGPGYGSGVDNLTNIQNLVAKSNTLPNVVTDYLLPQAINTTRSGYTTVFLVSEINSFPDDLAGFENDTEETIAHELGHTLSLVHITGGNPDNYNQYPVAPGGTSDVMSYNDGPWAFLATIPQLGGTPGSLPALELGLDQQVTPDLVKAAASYYNYSRTNGGSK